jgi:hypothetical protein
MKSCAFVEQPGGSTPKGAVRLPHVLVGIGALVAAFGCSRLGGDQVMLPVVVGMTDTTPPIVDDGETQIYEVHMPVQFPLRAPRANEMNRLVANTSYPATYGPGLWLEAHDFQIEIRYTISNLSDKKQNVELLIDPWNEFVKYLPGLTVTEDETIPDRAGHDRTWVIQPKEKRQGTITNDDTLEMATDLGTVWIIQSTVAPPAMGMMGASLNALFNNTFDLQNRSSHPELNPLIAKYIPKIVPGLTGVDIGFRMNSAANVALEVIVDIVDLKMDRVIAPGEDKPGGKVSLPLPAGVLTPPAAPPP